MSPQPSIIDALVPAAGDDAVSTAPSDLARMAHDASHYLLTPRAVVTASSAQQVASVMAAASAARLPVTFRSGGTSLSGQSVSDGVLVDVRRDQAEVEVLDDGTRVRCQPGAVLRRVNAALARHGRKLGPDPASEIACTVGGVVANNSSGMTSSTTSTVYRTLESMVLVLPSGTVLDTGAPDADSRLRASEPELYAGLARLRDRVRYSPLLRGRIEHQFSMKNTMGYGLNALLDYDAPVEILAHLVIGSEGTLAYVAEVVLGTVPVFRQAATSLLVFDGIGRATNALPELIDAGAAAIELLDAASLRVAQLDPKATDLMRRLRVEEHTALLIELQHADAEALAVQRASMERTIAGIDLTVPATLSTNAQERAAMWAVRKGLYAAVAGSRPAGTTALLEDVVVPPEHLPGTVRQLRALLGRYGYDDAVTFGHAKDANLHFMINPRLGEQQEVEAYAAFTEDLVELVLGADGSLKAEHGTGRIMAPFVRRQYGDELYEVMQEIKRLCDPARVLNPGVVLDEDPQGHLRHLKIVPAVHPELDRCVECGYCEPVCPSRNTTTTPRQRIVLLREMAQSTPERRAQLERDYEYSAVQTCAADSLCATACPVGIDTGKVMKSFRAESRGPVIEAMGTGAARAWKPVTGTLRNGLRAVNLLPPAIASNVSQAGRAMVGEAGRDWLPQLGPGLPPSGRARSMIEHEYAPYDQADLVFFPACIGSIFGSEAEGAGQAFLRLCERVGLAVAVPPGIDSLCCGTVWESKGLLDGATAMAAKVTDQLWQLTDGGRRPVVVDASSCTHGLGGIGSLLTGSRAERWAQVTVVDAVTFARREMLPRLSIADNARLGSLMVHPTCSAVHLEAVDDLVAVANAVAEDVEVPVAWGCCGMAGDRGMLHPELVAGATAAEAAEVAVQERNRGAFDGYVSCNLTCEIGMSVATGRPYQHVLELLEQTTRSSY